MPARRRAGLFAVLCGLVFAGCFWSSDKPAETTETPPVQQVPQQNETERRMAELIAAGPQDFGRFLHDSEQHASLPCLLCHVRDDNSPQMKFSGHIPCASCHTEQFKDSNNAICTICHTNKDTGEMASFPGLKSFGVRFDHGRHLKIANCADCHKPAGAAVSIPTGGNAHASCFQCHTPDAKSGDQDIASCATCHEQGQPPRRASTGARAFAFNFSHADHSGARGLNCSSCHNVLAGQPRGRQVTAPTAVMHLASGRGQSCATCHNNKRAFGGDDFSDCKRCHVGKSFDF